jgi:nitroreductase
LLLDTPHWRGGTQHEADVIFNDHKDPLTFLRTRRSGKPRDLGGPGPDAGQLRGMLEIAMRTPDHGKLAPWRFVIVESDQRDALAALLERAYRAENPAAGRLEIEAMHQFAHQAPALVAVLSSPRAGSKIPVWEQELSAGAAIMNLLHAANASGFAGGWLTAWPSYSDAVRDAFGAPGERIAGFVFIGTPQRPLEERPRPEYDAVVSTWKAPA